MSKYNSKQIDIRDKHEGMVVVDAGPGTGKTRTIVARYVELIKRDDVVPEDVLLMTFTNNAAAEMEERISAHIIYQINRTDSGEDEKILEEWGPPLDDYVRKKLKRSLTQLQVTTFDAYCRRILMKSPNESATYLGFVHGPSHSFKLEENNTLIEADFRSYLDEFFNNPINKNHGGWGALSIEHHKDILGIINKLMSFGIFPKDDGWFGRDGAASLDGDIKQVLDILESLNKPVPGKKPDTFNQSELCNMMSDLKPKEHGVCPKVRSLENKNRMDHQYLEDAVKDPDRIHLYDFIHDLYWQYIERCIEKDTLTFGIVAMLAFCLLYNDEGIRDNCRYTYMMIDEFQDTSASQLMMALMCLKEPNLCVVGDWKQGIYGFKYVSIDNIVHFGERCDALRAELNRGSKRVIIPSVTPVSYQLEENYRSPGVIVQKAFDVLDIKGEGEDTNGMDGIHKHPLVTRQDESYGPQDAELRFVKAEDYDSEPEMVVRCVKDYVGSGRYRSVKRNGEKLNFGDIAVLCRRGEQCRSVYEALVAANIPAFLQDTIEIMSTREGKLALAWLRYVNNEQDPRGYETIMIDLGYTAVDCQRCKFNHLMVPDLVKDQRERLYAKRRRITELLTNIFVWYGLDNDNSQAIINVLSHIHKGSLRSISDLITLIEQDIEKHSTYHVDFESRPNAVRIMTMHKSKGLEFDAVIIPFIDKKKMPFTPSERAYFTFDEVRGLRSRYWVYKDDEGDHYIRKWWKTSIVQLIRSNDFDEERRLLFVAMTRSRQYLTMIGGDEPSAFLTGLAKGDFVTILDVVVDVEAGEVSNPICPDLSGYTKRVKHVGVHDLMGDDLEDSPEFGLGKEYGTEVHRDAELLYHGRPTSGKHEKEMTYIRENVLSRCTLDRCISSQAEVECSIPFKSLDVVVRGIMDLIIVCDDHVEVHDYKTDQGDTYEAAYRLQLSLYAMAAKSYGKPVRCFIDYVSVSPGRSVEFDPMSEDEVLEIVCNRLG